MSSGEEHKEKGEESVSSGSKSYKRKDGKKMNKAIFYRADTSTLASSLSNGETTSKKSHHRKTVKPTF
jgi:hypothetical protein